MAARSSDLRHDTRCRALVGGFGLPGLRDLDFGRHFVSAVEHLGWPEDVVVEDLSYAAHLVLHRLQELQPQKLLLVGAAARGVDAPGTIRRYQPGLSSPSGSDVHDRLVAAISGEVDVDHTLAILRHWGALPADTVVIEVEPVEAALGPGFSAELAAVIDPVLAAVQEEVGWSPSDPVLEAFDDDRPPPPEREEAAHMAVTGRLRAWGGAGDGGDWYDVIPLGGGWTGVAMGDVTGRGSAVSEVMQQVRGATRAYAVLCGTRPGQVLTHLDRLVDATGVGEMATVAFLAIHERTGVVKLSNAGHCPPLLLGATGTATFLEEGRSVPLGVAGGDRPEAVLTVEPGSTLLLYTDGLVESRQHGLEPGLEQLRRAVANGPAGLEDLCDHVITACDGGVAPDDDVALLALRRAG